MAQAGKKRKIFDERYEILSIVGRGAASVVYHARHIAGHESDVALKVLLNRKVEGSTTADLLRREALAMVSARHKYVVRLDDFHSVGELAYLSMEYAPEFDLRRFTQKLGGKLNSLQAELFLLQIAEALYFTHQAGIIHRDLKPDNILVISAKEARLADYGTALLPGEKSSLEDLRKGVGTMSYMAPEVLNGTAYDERSDIYALATSFYEMLSGVHPFENAPLLAQIEIRQDGAFKPLTELIPDVPERLAAVIMRAMSFDPEARYSTGRELAQALLEEDTKTPAVRPARGPGRERRKPPRRPAPSAAAEPQPQTDTEVEQPQEEAQKQAGFVLGEARKDSPAQDYPRGIHQVPKQVIETAEAARKETVYIPGEQRRELTREAQAAPEPSQTRPVYEEEDQYQEPPAQRSIRARQVRRSGNKLFLVLALGAFLAVLVLANGRVNNLSRKYLHVDLQTSLFSPAEEKPVSPLPVHNGEELSFPLLPAGVYSGSISDIKPGQSVALSLIAIPDWDKLVVLIGVEGWSPAVLSYESIAALANQGKPLRIKSNGFVIDLTGQIANAGIIGYYRNIITGEQGEWKLRPES